MKGIPVLTAWFILAQASNGQSIQWETVHPQPGLPVLRAVAFGEDRFVAAGDGGVFFSNDAGRTWQSGTNSPAAHYTGVAFANGVFVAVGRTNELAVSDDGVTWETHALPVASAELLEVLHGNGRWVASGTGGRIATSADARSWSVAQGPADMNLELLAYGGGKFVATDGAIAGGPYETNSARVLISTNGADWAETTVEIPFVVPGCVPNPRLVSPCKNFERLRGLTFANGQFLALAQYSSANPPWVSMKILVSADATHWTALPESAAGDAFFTALGPENNLVQADGRFLNLLGRTVSTNLNQWAPLPLHPPYDPMEFSANVRGLHGAAYGDSTYLLVGELSGWALVARSADLSTFERLDSPRTFRNPRSVAARGSIVVAAEPGASQGLIASTNSGFSFAYASLPDGSGSINALHAAQEKFVAVGGGGTILRSTDGMNWSKRLSNTSRDLQSVTFGNGLWVAVGLNGAIATSPDASFFTLRPANTDIALRSVTFGGGQFVAVGDAGAILRSTDGQNWNIFGTEEAANLFAITHSNGRFVATGASGIVHTSIDAIAWTSTRLPGAVALSDAASADGHFITIDPAFSEWAHLSTNGLDWKAVRIPKPVRGADSSDGKLWLVGDGVYLARAVFETSAAGPRLSAAVDSSGRLTVSFLSPQPATYDLLSTPQLLGGWQTAATLADVSGTVTWTNTAPLAGARFYILRRRG